MGSLWIILSVLQAIYLLDVSSQYFYEIKKDIERDQAENSLLLGEEIFQCNLDDGCKRVIKRQNEVGYEKQYGQLEMQSQLDATVLLEKKKADQGIGIALSQSEKTFIIRHSSGKCMALRPNTNQFIISSSCEDRFMFLPDQRLKHVNSGKCVNPLNGRDGANVRLSPSCNKKSTRFVQTQQGAIQNIQYQKCIQSEGGEDVPADNTNLVIGQICNLHSVRFNFVLD
eukprot:Seg4472.1 transcript_id=Seg4472.1/GoldUCD/mRNA.D3Y31 product="hypothetical protein" protein_id=Seg4472.1/GoldUCD/D3Y31